MRAAGRAGPGGRLASCGKENPTRPPACGTCREVAARAAKNGIALPLEAGAENGAREPAHRGDLADPHRRVDRLPRAQRSIFRPARRGRIHGRVRRRGRSEDDDPAVLYEHKSEWNRMAVARRNDGVHIPTGKEHVQRRLDIHTLEGAYLAVLTKMRAADIDVSDGAVPRRVRSRIHGLYKSGAIKRVGPAAYILGKDWPIAPVFKARKTGPAPGRGLAPNSQVPGYVEASGAPGRGHGYCVRDSAQENRHHVGYPGCCRPGLRAGLRNLGRQSTAPCTTWSRPEKPERSDSAPT